jgi:hypothetical protein
VFVNYFAKLETLKSYLGAGWRRWRAVPPFVYFSSGSFFSFAFSRCNLRLCLFSSVFFFSLPYMLCPSLRILCFLPPLPLLCSAVFFFFFFVLPGFIPLFPPPGFFRFSLSPLVCSLFQFFPLFFFSGLPLYTLCPSPAQEEDDGDKGMRCCWLNGSSLLCVFSFSSLC